MNIKDILNSNEKMGNSFSQSVYKIDEDKILKIYNNIDKGKNELDYLKYFANNLNVSKVLDSGIYDDKFYIIMSYIKGKNYIDEEEFTLTDEIYKKIGILLGKMHNLEPLKEDKWKEYMLYRIERNYKILKENNINFDIDKVYNYLIKETNELQYDSKCMHSDFRVGNLIITDDVYVIDLESVKSGDPIFDFVKLYRLFTKENFKLFKEGYENIRNLTDDFYQKLHFYNLYDAFTTVGWCIEVNRFNSDFYKFNMKFLKEEMKYLWEKEVTQLEKNMDSSILKK